MLNLLAWAWPGPMEMIILAGLGLLFFGKRLPEVGRSVGRTIVEFKKGMKEVEREVEAESARPALDQPARFDPVTGKPLSQPAETKQG